MSSPSTKGPARRLNPDKLAEMEEQRGFLLDSLDDLQAEYQAGDIDDVDYQELKDDYTLRLADTQRSIQEQRNLIPAKTKASTKQRMLWLLGLGLLGLIAGIFVAQASGNRLDGETATGDIRTSVVTRLNQARGLFSDPERWDEAVEIYETVLDEQPSNVEAITYRAWLLYRRGDWIDESIDQWNEALLLESQYPDALVFRTIALSDERRWDEAEASLAEFDAADPPPELQGLVEAQGLRFEILAVQNLDVLQAEQTPSLADVNMTADEALGVAGWLLAEEEPDGPTSQVLALKLYEAILLESPDDPAALSRSALIYTRTGVEQFVADAQVRVDRAVAANPKHPEALLSQAVVYAPIDVEVTCAALDALDILEGLPEAIIAGSAQIRAASGC